MADSKITTLTALTAADPTVDMFPVVDVSDTTMAASGTTKRISINNILACSPSATLASATITGDLTVDTSTLKVDSTNNRVGIGTATPAEALTVAGKIRSVSSTFGLSDVIAETTAGTGTGYARLIVKTADREWRLINDASTSGSPFIIYDATANAESLRIATAGVYTFGDGAGGTRMTLNSTGLGVGGSPSYKLHVNGTDATNVLFNGATKGVRFVASASKYSITGVDNTGAATFQPLAIGGASLEFQIGSTTQMTLDASGNLLVGTTSNPNSSRAAVKTASVTSALSLNSVTGDTAQELFVINKFDSNSTTSQVFARFTNNNGAAGSGQINGNGANACAFGSFSDARLKENIVSLPSQLANILSLRPVEFDYKDGSGHQIGFVAQEIQEVYADTVAEQNGFLTVTGWSKTEARLVSAIKELAAKVQALEAKLA